MRGSHDNQSTHLHTRLTPGGHRLRGGALVLAAAVGLLLPLWLGATARGDDWPQWGRTATKNMSAPDERGLPESFSPGKFIGASDKIDATTSRNVKWLVKLGSQSYGNPTVAGGRVYVGTNNESPRDPRFVGDRSCVYCFDEKTGEFQWQLAVPKMGTGKVSDWEYLGICSSPTIENDRVYLVTNLCEVVCLDARGMSNGNDGPFQDEGAYMAGKGAAPVEVTATDADILWITNMIDECGVFPHNITCSSLVVAGDRLWVTTSNGVDYGHVETPAPFAPSLIVVDKRTGRVLAEEDSGLSQRILHCNWTSPAYLKSGALDLCIFGGPDGRCYAFGSEFDTQADGRSVLREVWRFDCNLPEYRERDGQPIKYATPRGPSEVIATPVVHGNQVFVGIGQDPEHGEGAGNFVCIDATGKGDITTSGRVWNYTKINRTLSTASIVDGLVFVADFSGFVYCFDAVTGDLRWRHDTKAHIWGSTLVADGKVYVGNEDGYVTVLQASSELNVLNEVDMISPVHSSPIAANGVIFIATHTHLFALDAKDAAP